MTTNSFLFCWISALVFMTFSMAVPIKNDLRPALDLEDPDYVMELIRLGHSLLKANQMEGLTRLPNGEGFNKRGLDLGLGRGFSGSQAAKHLMGLAAANYAGGPGRRKRSLAQEAENGPKFAPSQKIDANAEKAHR